MDKIDRNGIYFLCVLGCPYIQEHTDPVGLMALYTLGGRSSSL